VGTTTHLYIYNTPVYIYLVGIEYIDLLVYSSVIPVYVPCRYRYLAALLKPSTFADIKSMACNKKTREKAMILCDRCDATCHIFRMDPPLEVVPEGDWVCKGCKQKERKAQAKKRATKAALTAVDE
jgi:hypothetical protein